MPDLLQRVSCSCRLVHIKESCLCLALLCFLFGLWFLRRQLRFPPPWSSPARTPIYYTPFLFLSICQLAVHFSPPVTYSVTITYGDTLTPVVCRRFLVPELGEFGFRGGIELELESLCHSSLFSAVADSNLQLQKIWFVGSLGEFILGIQSYYQWALSCGCEFSPIFELSLSLSS